MQIRLAEPDDLMSLAAIRGDDAASVSHWLSRITAYFNGTHHPQQALPQRVIFIASVDSQIIGFIAGHLTRRYDCDGELQWIDTIPEYRGRGVATALFRTLCAWFAPHEAKRICVNCAPDNVIAKKFYRKNGAVPLNEYWLVWEDVGRLK